MIPKSQSTFTPKRIRLMTITQVVGGVFVIRSQKTAQAIYH
jgi:hypothetical protein